MKITPESLTILAARFGMASAKVLAQLTTRERLTADLQTQQALARSVEDSIDATHPLYRKPVRQRLAAVRARVRALASALDTDCSSPGTRKKASAKRHRLRATRAKAGGDAG